MGLSIISAMKIISIDETTSAYNLTPYVENLPIMLTGTILGGASGYFISEKLAKKTVEERKFIINLN